jgi:hypothetical protein
VVEAATLLATVAGQDSCAQPCWAPDLTVESTPTRHAQLAGNQHPRLRTGRKRSARDGIRQGRLRPATPAAGEQEAERAKVDQGLPDLEALDHMQCHPNGEQWNSGRCRILRRRKVVHAYTEPRGDDAHRQQRPRTRRIDVMGSSGGIVASRPARLAP